MNNKMRKHLSAPGLIHTLSNSFSKISDKKVSRTVTLQDCLLSGIAMFGLKSPSLFQFDRDSHDMENYLSHNLKNLYGIEAVPCDTYLRERLDEISPQQLRPAFNALLSQVQRGKSLEAYQYYKGKYLISSDGTGMFSSKEVHCENCCVKNHRDGSKTYYHQMLCASIVHPDLKQVLPLAPEPIVKSDGVKKNDCERNASKRLIKQLRREHPNLEMIFVEDALASNAPHIETLREHKIDFILGVKPGDHAWLFDWVKSSQCETHIIKHEKLTHEFEFINDVPLNDARSDIRVNFLSYKETNKKGKSKYFTWITGFKLNKNNVYQIMRGGRARWKIENEAFNTLKNQGYHFEHNFGHGNKYLCSVFGSLMLLAFLIDQIQEMACPFFKKALAKRVTRKSLWERLKSYFHCYCINSWEDIYQAIAGRAKKVTLIIDSG